jgi:hypothetical protein
MGLPKFQNLVNIKDNNKSYSTRSTHSKLLIFSIKKNLLVNTTIKSL